MPRVSAEEQKKQQKRGQAYTTVTGQQTANIQQQKKQQVQSVTAPERQKNIKQVAQSYQPFRVSDAQNWDYKTATTGMNGEPLPSGALGFDPRGRPYFGTGLAATVKRYAYEWNKDVDAPSAEKWDEINKGWKDIAQQAMTEKPSVEGFKEFAAGTLSQAGKTFSAAWQAGEGSFLEMPLKAVRIGTTALMEGLSEPAIKFEQALGAQRSAAEMAQTSGLKTIDFKNDAVNLAANILLPPLAAYNAYRFFSAPGTVKEKQAALDKGFTEGRLLYTSFVEPAVRQEYEARVKAGEDPYLLAMELENPFAEAAGQLLLDPLNVLGVLSKGGKVANVLDDAADMTRKSGLAGEAADIFKGAEHISDTKHVAKLDDFAGRVKNFFYEGDTLRELKPQSYKINALNASGNRTRLTKQMGNIVSWMSGNLMAEGRPVDDMLEYVSGLLKLSSRNLDEVKDGIATLAHFPSPSTHFGESFLETSAMLRNIIGEEQDVAKFVKRFDAAKGDWEKVGQIAMGMVGDAAKTQFPTIAEMRQAAETVSSGQKVTARTTKLAEQFKNLEKTKPGLVRLAQIDELASKPKNAINKILGNFYFSYQYGVAARNKIQNDLITLIDAGPGAWLEKGKFTLTDDLPPLLQKWFQKSSFFSESTITEKILATHGGQLPPAATGFESLRTTLKAGSDKLFGIFPSGSALMEKYEISSAKRVYWKYYRDAITKMAEPGRALPSVNEFKAVGFTDEQIGKFTRLVKDNYGDVNKAMGEFNELFKNGQADKWRLFESYLPKHVLDGLDEAEIMDEISVLTRTPDITRNEIVAKIDDLIEEITTRARSTIYDSPGTSRDNPFVETMADWSEIAKPDYNTSVHMNVLQESAIQTKSEYLDALYQAVRKENSVGNPVPIDEYNRIFINTPDKELQLRQTNSGVLKSSREALENVRYKGADPIREWQKLPFGDDVPPDLTKNNFGDYIYSMSGYNGYIARQIEQYAQEAFDASEGLARQFGLEGIFENAKKARMDFEKYRTADYRGGGIFDVSEVVSTGENATDIRKLANKYGVASATKEGKPNDKHILNIINKADDTELMRAERAQIESQLFDANTPKSEIPVLKARAVELDNYLQPAETVLGEAKKYERLEDVPLDVAKRAFAARGEAKGIRIPPPYPDGATPSMARAWAENSEGAIEALQTTKQMMLENFGVKTAAEFNTDMSSALKGFAKQASDKMAEGRLIAQKSGQYWRDFALLPYGETTHMDHALSYIFPYQFWYSRSYGTWVKRLASDPQIVAAYAKFKDKMASAHKEAPEWWKYNVTLPEWMWGLNNNNPMYINLEAAVWPLYGITGTDFNEPRKRVDWLTSTVDDMGKFGPSVWAPIQIAMAAMLQSKGDKEAASYWGSRLIPQTAAIKSVMSLLGKTPIELDPAVQQFSGEGIFDWSAQDQYEQRRTGRQLGAMINEGIPEEVLADAAYSHQGQLWDEAYRRATDIRAPGQLASFLFGVGFKARTPEDVEIDKFYSDMHRLMQLREADLISPKDYTNAWDELRDRYPFMDVMLLSRKAGDLRDEAYAWNVINRIPPGQSRDVFEKLGINPDTAQKFYENRGDMSGMSEKERERFMNAIVQAGAILSIPNDADREEWNIAKDDYKDMQGTIEQQFGNDIQDRISLYYGLKDRQQAKDYLEANPDVQQAMRFQDELILQNPVLSKYYGGLDTFERHYSNQMYDELEKRYGDNITEIAAAYSQAKYQMFDKELAEQILKENPKLKKYWNDKRAMQDVLNRAMIDFGSKLPEQPYPEFRKDYADLTPEQQAVMAGQNQRSFAEFAQITGPTITELAVMYFEGEELPKEVLDELDYLAPKYGYYSGKDMLIEMGIAYQTGQ